MDAYCDAFPDASEITYDGLKAGIKAYLNTMGDAVIRKDAESAGITLSRPRPAGVLTSPTDTLIALLKAMVEEREIGHEIKDDGQVLLDAQDVYAAIRAHDSNEIPGGIPSEIPVVGAALVGQVRKRFTALRLEVSGSIVDDIENAFSDLLASVIQPPMREAQPEGEITYIEGGQS